MTPSAPALAGPSLSRDLLAGVVVFLVALPLSVGIAQLSGAPPASGILSAIVGGVVVGALSRSHTSVSGPAAGLVAVVATQIGALGFDGFLLAVVLAGVLQLGLGFARVGAMARFLPTAVIKGLLAAVGLLLILKQVPHLLGHDTDPIGEMAFAQYDRETTFSELWTMFGDVHAGAALIGLVSLALLLVWDRVRWLKDSRLPAALVVVVVGVLTNLVLGRIGGDWAIGASHLVQVPTAADGGGFFELLSGPDFGRLTDVGVYTAALIIAVVASLETVLNLAAVDVLDPYKRNSRPERELFAQGAGNITAGLLGGLPMAAVLVRGSVNIEAGATTRRSAISHGVLLLVGVALLPAVLNLIPLAALAAILFVTGTKLVSPRRFREMWGHGRHQFLPFAVTVLAIVFTDLLIGIIIGLVVAVGFILQSNLRHPMRRYREKHVGGEVTRIELPNQVTFLNRAALSQALDEAPAGGQLLLDASQTDYIDPDVLELIQDFERQVAPARDVRLSLRGFRSHYAALEDRVVYVDHTDRDAQHKLTPEAVLELLREGNERFRSGYRLNRDLTRQVGATAQGQFPMAAVLSCIDSRAPVELLFDLGLGDVFSVRIAGNVARSKVLGSLEYSSVVAGAKVILVMGHTACGAVNAAVDLVHEPRRPSEATGCDNIDLLVEEIQRSIDPAEVKAPDAWSPEERKRYADEVAWRNVLRTIEVIRAESPAIDRLVRAGRLGLVGAMYDVRTGRVDFHHHEGVVPADQSVSGLESSR